MTEKRFEPHLFDGGVNEKYFDGIIDNEDEGIIRNYHYIANLLNALHEENIQLKETIDELRTIDKEKYIEMEHINNIYNEFGFKGVIDYAKDKLYNYGAVREVDEGLWLLATGGWSDNEFWLDCLLYWDFMYAKGHYGATTSGGGYYYSEEPYADISVMLNNTKEELE